MWARMNKFDRPVDLGREAVMLYALKDGKFVLQYYWNSISCLKVIRVIISTGFGDHFTPNGPWSLSSNHAMKLLPLIELLCSLKDLLGHAQSDFGTNFSPGSPERYDITFLNQTLGRILGNKLRLAYVSWIKIILFCEKYFKICYLDQNFKWTII